MKRFLFWMLPLLVLAGFATACDDEANSEPTVGDPELRVTCDLNITLPSASATAGTIAYEVLYPVGTVVATAESDASWLTPYFSTDGTRGSSSQGLPNFTAKISYQVAANRGEARSAQLVLDYAGVSRVTLVFRQPAGSGAQLSDLADAPKEGSAPSEQ